MTATKDMISDMPLFTFPLIIILLFNGVNFSRQNLSNLNDAPTISFSLINNENYMNNDELAQHVFDTPKRQEEEKYREEKERTLEILNDGLHRRGYEIGGISTDELVDLIILNMDQGEVKFLIDRLVIRYGKTFGERLFE
jgi:hypothetical protein